MNQLPSNLYCIMQESLTCSRILNDAITLQTFVLHFWELDDNKIQKSGPPAAKPTQCRTCSWNFLLRDMTDWLTLIQRCKLALWSKVLPEDFKRLHNGVLLSNICDTVKQVTNIGFQNTIPGSNTLRKPRNVYAAYNHSGQMAKDCVKYSCSTSTQTVFIHRAVDWNDTQYGFCYNTRYVIDQRRNQQRHVWREVSNTTTIHPTQIFYVYLLIFFYSLNVLAWSKLSPYISWGKGTNRVPYRISRHSARPESVCCATLHFRIRSLIQRTTAWSILLHFLWPTFQ